MSYHKPVFGQFVQASPGSLLASEFFSHSFSVFCFCILQLNQNLHDVLLGLDKQYSGNAFPVKAQPRSVTVGSVFPSAGEVGQGYLFLPRGMETSKLSVASDLPTCQCPPETS